MNRTYNIFVDNGLYVLGYYLEKDIKDITFDDIKNSTGIIAELFKKYGECDYYKKNIDRGFHNSAYTQNLKKINKTIETREEKVKRQYDLILNNLGEDEYCSICGEKHIKLNIDENYRSALSRCLMPRLHSNTFINYINNLQLVNICPICIYLSMISLFNTYKSGGNLILYNSDDNNFLEDYTYKIQSQLEQNIFINAKEPKKNKTITESIEDIISFNKKDYNGYIQIISFYNGGQRSEFYKEDILSKKDIVFIKKLQDKMLLSEFKLKGLFNNLIKNKLQNNYLKYVFDNKKQDFTVSIELFKEIEEEYSKLNKNELQLVKDICKKVYVNTIKDEIKELNNISKINQFENLLIKWNKEYNNKTNNLLFNTDEFDSILCNYKNFNSIKSRMIVEFMVLNNKKNK